MEILQQYSGIELTWIGLSIFMLGMSKGGFPIGTLALPILVLVWPGGQEPAKKAVSFMLPMLCAMDVVAIAFYRKHILWKKIWPLLPGSIVGVIIGSIFFVSKENAILSVPDKVLKLFIGIIGILFVTHKIADKWILKRLAKANKPSFRKASIFGIGAGLSSTLAHAAGPIIKMYYLPQDLKKMNFAATIAAFFWMLNLIKMIPFTIQGRIESDNLLFGAYLLPLIPLGVGLGYMLVKIMKPKHYIGFIYFILTVTSSLLIIKAIQT